MTLRHRSPRAGRGFAAAFAALLATATGAFAAPPQNPEQQRIAGELAAAHLPEPLVATASTTAAEDAALARAIAIYENRRDGDDFSSFEGFLAAHPQSGWRVAVLTDLGIDYRHYGYLSRALAAWQAAWREGKTAAGYRAKALVDRAVGELVKLDAELGRKDQLAALLGEIGDRPVSGPGTEMVLSGRETLYVMQTDPKHLYLCGPRALKALMLLRHATPEQVGFLNKVRAGPKGTSLAEVEGLAKEGGLSLEPVFRKPGEPVPVPSIVHWKVGHFAAIVGEHGDRYQVSDAALGHQSLWVGKAALDAEASGYFLVLAEEAQGAGWRKVAAGEADRVWGAGGLRPASAPDAGSSGAASRGMTTYRINEGTVALGLIDTPVGYAPPKGPPPAVSVFYDQYDVSQPANFGYFNVSQKWSLNWLSFVTDDPGAPGASVERYDRGNGYLYSETGYDSSTGGFTPEEDDASLLVLENSSPITYQRFLKDGSVEVYAQSDGAATFPRNVFLSRVIDPEGNAVTLGYVKTGGKMRLVSLTDATGRKTSFTYGLAGFPLLVTKVTDPFGRSATLGYDAAGRLISITDVLGLTSKFAYDAASMVNSLTTPYGTTRFAYGMASGPGGPGDRRFLNIVDPLGYGEREETFEPASVVPFSDPHAPQGMPVPLFNSYLSYRDSFHWGKHQYGVGGCTPAGGCAYDDARVTHFTHDGDDTGVRGEAVESYKKPLEGRVWFTYPGQPASGLAAGQSGSYDMPSGVGRVLDDGETQLRQFAYNAAGNPTEIVDPVGRETTLTYAANQIDIASIAQATAAGGQTLAKFAFNAQHRPLSYTDAAGRASNFTYNSAGQLTSATNALGQKTSYVYNALGYLTAIINANGKTAASLAYDGFGRVASYADSEGWTVKFAYDAADRLTRATYPDGTTEQYTYNRLDLVSIKDRQGRVWSFTYDADRRLTGVADPLGHKTSYAYFEDGTLKSLTDPDGHTTSWDIDAESRPVAKHYADGTDTTYQYELTTGRLKSTTDALGQTKQYHYALDDRLAGIRYPNALNPTPNVGFAYDPYFPRIAAMTDGAGTTSYAYVPIGALGALHLQRETGPLPSGAIAYAYDALGRVIGRTVGGAPAETFQYDAIGRLVGHTDALGRFATAYLGQTGQPTRRAPAASGISTNWSYLGNPGDRRLAGILNATARQFQYATTADNLVSQIKENKGATLLQSWGIAYDNDNRLTAANSTSGARYGYMLDPAGNPTQIAGPTGAAVLTYNKVNALTAVGPQAVVSDADGNIVSDGARTYSWDAENRLIAIAYAAAPDKRTSFAYDGLGRRTMIATTLSGHTTVEDFIWCGVRICQSRNGPAAVNRLYYDEGETIPGSKALFYYGPDRLGSVRDVFATSPVFSMVQAYDYDPYGNPTVTAASGPYTDFRFAGMYYHADSGLYLTQFRAYDPRTGRWLTRDPIGEFAARRPLADAVPPSLAPGAGDPLAYIQAHQGLLSMGPLFSIAGGYGIDGISGFAVAAARGPLADFREAGRLDPAAAVMLRAGFRAADPRGGPWPSLGPMDESGGQNLYAYVGDDPINAVDLAGLGQAPPKPLPWPGPFWWLWLPNWGPAWQNQWNSWGCWWGDQWNQFLNNLNKLNAATQLNNVNQAASQSGH